MKLINLINVTSLTSDSIVEGEEKLENVYKTKTPKKKSLPKVKKSVYGIDHSGAEGGAE